jgi:hypothetical protein
LYTIQYIPGVLYVVDAVSNEDILPFPNCQLLEVVPFVTVTKKGAQPFCPPFKIFI